ncbi:uncharacterized protein BO66DRAFT_455797 [Aspergillus aculeatinus CBS 121060]|uniref:Uncharacterized protein n=1 Tax=Aspergillus aculeatinus CBS 121060 TaxID=1448322 RepID=A0ACD1H3B0_9EURO|nr:hypothetical protein BO66DRAFT_455797 [Aspergillus aculeatinus CBS 121060]RAH68048.1 hypothetical protein BO66DRAFT_455797 [Aspergillus aculeatinus CBS 121060]
MIATEIAGLVGSLSPSKVFLVAFAVLNWKSLPFAWTTRLVYWFIRGLYDLAHPPSNPSPPVDLQGNPTHPIFAVGTTTSYCSLLETDYNFHKSNSTYYADLDASRITPMAYFYWPGREKVSAEIDAELAAQATAEGIPPPKSAPIFIALGGVYCSFKKEIKPFERYEMRSQVVAWDRKWIYVLTHFVKTGRRNKDGSSIVAAVGMSKYCVKKGRLTVPVERLLAAGGKVPVKPVAMADKGSESSVDAQFEFTPAGKAGREWTWEQIEAQRLQGLKYCRSFMGIDDDFYGSS